MMRALYSEINRSMHPPPIRSDMAIRADHLSRSFGGITALQDVSLSIARGTIFGLLGESGSGKTTLMKLLMGHLRPDAGSVTVLNRDLSWEADVLSLRQRVGYVPEQSALIDRMRVGEILRFTGTLHTTWDQDRANGLVERFRLPVDVKVRHLSADDRTRLRLILALSYHPELLLLDAPTVAMAPRARREFMEVIIDEIGATGTTVLWSTHQVDEIERVADTVGILHEGRMLINRPIHDLQTSVCTFRCLSDRYVPDLWGLPGLLHLERFADEQVATVRDFDDNTIAALDAMGVIRVERVCMSLEDIFLALVRAADTRR